MEVSEMIKFLKRYGGMGVWGDSRTRCFDGTFMSRGQFYEGIRLRSGTVLPIPELVESDSDSDSDVSYVDDTSVTSDVWSDDDVGSEFEKEETIEETTEEKVETVRYESDSETETTETKVVIKTETNIYR